MARTLAAEDDKVARRAEISRQAAGAAPDNRDFTTVTVWGLVDKSPSRTSLHAAMTGLFAPCGISTTAGIAAFFPCRT